MTFDTVIFLIAYYILEWLITKFGIIHQYFNYFIAPSFLLLTGISEESLITLYDKEQLTYINGLLSKVTLWSAILQALTFIDVSVYILLQNMIFSNNLDQSVLNHLNAFFGYVLPHFIE